MEWFRVTRRGSVWHALRKDDGLLVEAFCGVRQFLWQVKRQTFDTLPDKACSRCERKAVAIIEQ